MRQTLATLPASKIREVANAGLGRGDVLAFWFGESDEVTPAHIRDAAVRSLGEGETFYSHNLGLVELREALARYVSGLHKPVDADRIAVTSSGVSALMLAMQSLYVCRRSTKGDGRRELCPRNGTILNFAGL